MADKTSLASSLIQLTTATESAIQGLPQLHTILPPENGFSPLDAKNEIFLSYLQALALRNLTVIRSLKDGRDSQDVQQLSEKITRRLVEQRIYLERGVRPLEQKTKYEMGRVIQAADDEERMAQQRMQNTIKPNGKEGMDDVDSEEDESDDGESVDEDMDGASRPNVASMAVAASANFGQESRSTSTANDVYRPPRISATSMPTTESRERKERRPGRSTTLDEYVNTELSNAPLAQPSIGSTIAAGGRRNKDARELAKDEERRNYEETNLVRLPKESKKERAKQARQDRGGGFGGEEWKMLGDSVDRIGDLTRRKQKDSVLDKSRKRRAVEDGPRGDGIGNAFDMKKRRLEKKMRR